MAERPLIVIDPHPRTVPLICDEATRSRPGSLGRVVIHRAGSL